MTEPPQPEEQSFFGTESSLESTTSSSSHARLQCALLREHVQSEVLKLQNKIARLRYRRVDGRGILGNVAQRSFGVDPSYFTDQGRRIRQAPGVQLQTLYQKLSWPGLYGFLRRLGAALRKVEIMDSQSILYFWILVGLNRFGVPCRRALGPVSSYQNLLGCRIEDQTPHPPRSLAHQYYSRLPFHFPPFFQPFSRSTNGTRTGS